MSTGLLCLLVSLLTFVANCAQETTAAFINLFCFQLLDYLVELYVISPQACLLMSSREACEWGLLAVSRRVLVLCVCLLLAVLLLCWNAETAWREKAQCQRLCPPWQGEVMDSYLAHGSQEESKGCKKGPRQDRVPKDTSQCHFLQLGPISQ